MFAAIIMRGTRETPRDYSSGEALLAALAPFTPADATGFWQDDRALIVQATHHNTPESLHEQAPEICAQTGRVIASWVRLDNRDLLCADLNIENRPTLTDPQIILAAHRQWGEACAARLEGDFSFVIYDPARGDTYCARDAIGARPFFYHLTDTHFIAASSPAAICAVDRLALRPDLRWTILFALGVNFSHDRAAFADVRKLVAAHALCVAAEGAVTPRCYFQFDLDAPHADTRDPIWVDRYRNAFDHAVAVRARSAFLVGCETSAGLDSSSILAQLARVLPHSIDQLHAFGMADAVREPEMLLLTSAMCDVRHTHILTRPRQLGSDDAFHRALRALGHPPEHGQMLAHPAFFEIGQHVGMRTLLSGFGGDEIVTSYAANLGNELVARRAYGALWGEMQGRLPMRAARFAKRLWQGPTDPHAGLSAVIPHALPASCIRRDVLEDSGLAAELRGWAHPDAGALTLNRLAAGAPGFRLALSGRLESASIFAATYGIDYRWPLLDRALIAQYLATPSIEKRRRQMGRYLHRRAMQGRIPESIQWQVGKRMGQYIGGRPHIAPHQPMAFDALPDLLRSIIDEGRFNTLQAEQQASAAGADEIGIRRALFLFRVRQLSAWLGGQWSAAAPAD